MNGHVPTTATTASKPAREANILEPRVLMRWCPSTSLSSWVPEDVSATNSRDSNTLSSCVTGSYTYDVGSDEAGNAFPCQRAQEPHDFLLDPSHYVSVPETIMPQPEDVAINYFLCHFAFQNGSWDYVVRYAAQPEQSPSLVFAIKACGMTALSNVHYSPGAAIWSRRMYGKALSLLNLSLCDRTRSTSDESLIAVNMLSFYEVSNTRLLYRDEQD